MNLQPATYKISYNNKDISADISNHLISLSYVDKVQGECDELSLHLEDTDALWQNAWYPDRGAIISAEIALNGNTLKCGNFTIDEIDIDGSRAGDTVNIKAVAAGFTKQLRTKRSTAHENKTLREIANTVAARHGLTVQGNIPNITLERVTQHKKNDLEFLQKIAIDFGLVFSIRDKLLIFTNVYELEGRSPSMTFDKNDLLSWNLKDKTAEVYKSATVKYQNPDDGELNEFEQDDPEVTDVEDSLEIRDKAENSQQAQMKAESRLHQANSAGVEATFSIVGNALVIAGNNIQVNGLGKLSGIFHIIQSTHTVERGGGYSTSAEAKRVGMVDSSNDIPKKKAVAAKPKIEKHGHLLFVPDPQPTS